MLVGQLGIEGIGLSAMADLLGAEINVEARRIDWHPGVANRRQNAAPIRIGACPGGLDQWGMADRPSNLERFVPAPRLLDIQPDHVLNTFAIADYLLSKRLADVREGFGEF